MVLGLWCLCIVMVRMVMSRMIRLMIIPLRFTMRLRRVRTRCVFVRRLMLRLLIRIGVMSI